MNFLEKLETLLEEKDISKLQLAKKTGIPYTTITSFWDKGYVNTKLSTLKKLAKFFDCSLDYLVDDTVTERNKRYAIPKELREIGVDWMWVAHRIKKSGLNPEQIEKLVDALKDIK